MKPIYQILSIALFGLFFALQMSYAQNPRQVTSSPTTTSGSLPQQNTGSAPNFNQNQWGTNVGANATSMSNGGGTGGYIIATPTGSDEPGLCDNAIIDMSRLIPICNPPGASIDFTCTYANQSTGKKCIAYKFAAPISGNFSIIPESDSKFELYEELSPALASVLREAGNGSNITSENLLPGGCDEIAVGLRSTNRSVDTSLCKDLPRSYYLYGGKSYYLINKLGIPLKTVQQCLCPTPNSSKMAKEQPQNNTFAEAISNSYDPSAQNTNVMHTSLLSMIVPTSEPYEIKAETNFNGTIAFFTSAPNEATEFVCDYFGSFAVDTSCHGKYDMPQMPQCTKVYVAITYPASTIPSIDLTWSLVNAPLPPPALPLPSPQNPTPNNIPDHFIPKENKN